MELIRFFESIRSPFWDTIIGLITQLGEETIGIIIMCVLFWCFNKRTAYGIGIALILSGITVQGMKICFRIERPWIIDPTLNPIPGALEYATGYSFPSGHTQSAAALYGTLGAQIKNKPLKTVFFIIPILVALSRVYLGVHTLLDVVASLVISFAFIYITLKVILNDSNTNSKKRELNIAIVIIMYSIAAVIIAAVLHTNGTIATENVIDCVKIAGTAIGFAIGMYIERVHINFSVKSKSIMRQAVKVILGIIGLVAIMEGLKLVIGTGFISDMIRYFLMTLWIIALYPLIIKRFFILTFLQ
ncbi:MAG: phosphatase PAP2 family protein [Oscillospiraceae bacterium]|nr:phosphatase PAP2 family protein [Oscillospiraceae bacterium]